MDDDGGLGIRSWDYYEQSIKGNIELQLRSSGVDQDVKPLVPARDFTYMIPHVADAPRDCSTRVIPHVSGGDGFVHRNFGFLEAQLPPDFVRDPRWMAQRERLLHVLLTSPSYTVMSEPPESRPYPLQMLQQPEPVREDAGPELGDIDGTEREGPLKKRSKCNPCKPPKAKTPKKVVPKDKLNASVAKRKTGNKNTGMVINGIDMDFAGLPIPVCSCTGTPQQCYKWGIGGWQSACCTTNLSMHPLPMNNKRRGARMAGRKMSQGAFKKVLEKLLSEGCNLSIPIDLKPYWAKHGTNKFVTIR